MTDNKLLGIRQVKIRGKLYSIQFTWEEISTLESKYGEVPNVLGDLDKIAECAAIGMQRFHPGITAADLRALSPPVFALQAAVMDALRFAYWGDEEPEAVAAVQEGAKKKPRPLRRFLRWLSALALPRQNSGD